VLTTSIEDGIEVVEVGHGGVRELFLTATPGGVTDLGSLLARIHGLLSDTQAEVLETRIFGTVDAFPSCVETLQGLLGPISWPLAFIQGEDCFAKEVAGIQLHAVAGAPVETIRLEGRPVGRVFEDDHTRYCVLGNLQSSDPSLPRVVV
jgi:hypothetical protein